jgi:pentatricopeptide repeat protein
MERCRLIAQRVLLARRVNPRLLSTRHHAGSAATMQRMVGLTRLDSSQAFHEPSKGLAVMLDQRSLSKRTFATSGKNRNKGDKKQKPPRKQQQLTTQQDVQNAWDALDRQLEKVKKDPMNSGVSPKDLTRSFNDAVNTWRRSIPNVHRNRGQRQQRNILSEATAVLAKLDRCIPLVLPNNVTYNMIMSAVNKQGSRKADVARFVETILKRMKKESKSNALVKPDVVTYATVIDSWAKSRLPNAGEKVEAILGIMEDEGLVPNTICFNAVINAYAKSSNPVQAEATLDRMQELYQAGQNDANPTCTCLTMLYRCLGEK